MNRVEPITVSIAVALPPSVAFDVFVDEVEHWWRPGPYYWNDPQRAIGIRFERGVGGRWLETYDLVGDDVFVMGDITGWVPGSTLAMTYRTVSLGQHGYPVEIRWEPTSDGCEVTLTHGGWDVLGDDAESQRDLYGRGWEAVLGWYRDWAAWGSSQRLPSPPARQGYVLLPGTGLAGDTASKATRRSTFGSLSVTESVTTGGAPTHVHRYDDELFYVLDGVLLLTFEGMEHRLEAGGVGFVPRGLVHAWDTEGEARLLIITSPGGLEEFLTALHSWPEGYADAWRVLGERHGYTLV